MRLALSVVVAMTAGLVASVGLAPPESAQTVPAGAPAEAIVGRRGARFTFPAEEFDRLSWPSPTPHAYPGLPTLAWEVDWSLSLTVDRFGVDPDAIGLIIPWRAEPAREWDLRGLLERSRPEVLTFCRPCGTPAAIPRDDPAVHVRVEGRRVVFSVHGQDAVRRLFPAVPESVTFTRRVWNEPDDRSIRIAVQRREP